MGFVQLTACAGAGYRRQRAGTQSGGGTFRDTISRARLCEEPSGEQQHPLHDEPPILRRAAPDLLLHLPLCHPLQCHAVMRPSCLMLTSPIKESTTVAM